MGQPEDLGSICFPRASHTHLHTVPIPFFAVHIPTMNRTIPSACLALLLITGCSESTPIEHHHGDMVSKTSLDSADAQNAILMNSLAYATMRAEICEGASGSLSRAKYHAERGEHSKAKPHLEKAKAHGPEHAQQATAIEASMVNTSTTKVTATKLEENIVTENDAADGITWYYDRRVPRDLDTTTFYLYVGHKETGAPWLRMHTQYAGDHWLFIKTIQMKAGDLIFERHPDPTLLFTKAGVMTVTEWNDTPPSSEDLRVIKEIIGSPDAELTFIGHAGTYTTKISDSEREAFINVLRLYQLMGKADESATM